MLVTTRFGILVTGGTDGRLGTLLARSADGFRLAALHRLQVHRAGWRRRWSCQLSLDAHLAQRGERRHVLYRRGQDAASVVVTQRRHGERAAAFHAERGEFLVHMSKCCIDIRYDGRGRRRRR